MTTEHTFAKALGNSVIIIKWNLPAIFVEVKYHVREKRQTFLTYGPLFIVELKNNQSNGESGSIFTKKNSFVMA